MELHPNEIKILKALKKKYSVNEIAEKTRLDPDAVNRTLSYLSTRELVKIEEQIIEEVSLGEEGEVYAVEGLPERRIIQLIKEGKTISEIRKMLGDGLSGIGINWLIRKKFVKISKVSKAKEGDVNRDVCRIDKKTGDTLDVKEGDNILIVSEKGSVTLKVSIAKEGDVNRDVCRIDKKTREKLHVEPGDSVFIISESALSHLNPTPDEKLLLILKERGRVDSGGLDGGLLEGLLLLRGRKNVVRISDRKMRWALPTEEGLKAGKDVKARETISQLTPQIIKTGGWRKGRFRSYDVDVFVRPEYPAKRHPLQRMVDDIREIFEGMGFKEIKGPLVESSFWNFDALFVPQDHPARDMHDTFYLENPGKVAIPDFEKFRDRVRDTHENGWTTGSTGWGYKWDEGLAKLPLLRTHTTSVTCRHLTRLKKEDLPERVFCIGKTFRNEAVDYKHLPEFYQVEGIVVDENANFKNLLGILDGFYREMGFKVRFRPAFFPYTEMSVEPEIHIKDRGWMELGGAGIFRPEVVKPLLGFECPVLAWGLGLDRVVALSLGLEDIRDLYIPDLDWLRRGRII